MTQEPDDSLIAAQAAAFALVSAADGTIAEAEVGRFVELVLGDRPGSARQLGERFARLAQGIVDDGEAGRSRALEVISRVKGSDGHIAQVLRAAQAAAAADMDWTDSETEALAMIRDALGVGENGR